MSGPVMTPPDAAPLPGWYGKIPALGDFASRRLPRAFIDFWDAWLQRQLVAVRAQLAERWPAAWLEGRAWRFMLAPGVCGTPCWAGLLMPSQDRVGRCFPLTIALALDPQPESAAAVLAAGDWFDALEAIALSAQDADAPPERLDGALLQTPFRSTGACIPPQALSVDPASPTLWWQTGDAGTPARLLAFCGMPDEDAAALLLAAAR